MCGIAGLFNPEINFTENKSHFTDIAVKMINSMEHRGPDDYGIVISEHAVLSHSRLSIIDLTTGHQPMTIKKDGRTYHIVYNGEIYNMNELKSALSSYDVHYETTSDTEIILLLYIHFGINFLKMLNGIYAFAIYDEANSLLYLVRDRFGVKPLYYATNNDTLVFASELNTLFESGLIAPKINNKSFNEILTLGPSKTPGCGVFEGINEVLPGEVITLSRNFVAKKLYYQIISKVHDDSYFETVEKVKYLVTDSIKRQMVSDVPIAAFLSGGIDSSIVSAVCAKELRKIGEQLTTYSFDFKDNHIYFESNSFQPEEDRPYVDIMKEHIGSKHIYLECDYNELADYLYESVDSRGLPTMADVDSSLLHFCRKVATNHKVVLTGECADEIFGGYPWFYRKELVESENFPWIMNFDFRKSLFKKDFMESLHMDEYLQNAYYKSISEINILPHENATETKRRRTAYLNIRWFMQTLLDRMDRTSMKSSLEARVPFADHRIVDYVFNIPWEMKYRDNTEKHLLRKAMTGIVPDSILFRKKSPYPKTYHPEYERILTNRLMDIINDNSSPLNNYIDKPSVIKFLDSPKNLGKPWYGQLMAGPQMIAYLIQIDYWMRKYKL